MFSDSQEKIDSSFKFLLVSRTARSIAIGFVTLSFSLYLNALGYELAFIGLLVLLVVLFNMGISILLGSLGDRIGYSRTLIVAEALPLAGLIGFALSSNIFIIEVSAILAGVTGSAGGMRGVFSPGTTAYVASNWSNEIDRVARLSKMTVVGSLASIVAGLLLTTHGYLTPFFGVDGTFRILFGVSSFILLISFLSLFFLKERKRLKKTTKVMKKESTFYTLRMSLPNVINGSAIGIATPLLPLWFELRYHISTSYVGEIFTLAYAATALGSFISGRYLNSSHIRAISVSSIARFFQGFLYIVIAFVPILPIAYSLYAIRMGVAGVGTPMRSAISVRGVGNEDYGTASSMQGVATRASQSTSGLSGYLMDLYLSSPLIIGGALQVVGSFVYYRVIRNWEKSHNFNNDRS
ncbi:MAG: MFS transporter [Candidatus Thermoplasmatota archaeon]|nr:MFS transporter [Candidatus Thermoplasmatota archaeon]MCL5790160.1 MFS transporter [Candidatus Thermoplasmatota archaeon]